MIKLHSTRNTIAKDLGAIKVARITTDENLPRVLRRDKALLIDQYSGSDLDGFEIVFSKYQGDSHIHEVQYLSEDLHYLADGDVVRIDPSRNYVRAIYRKNSSANFLFVTERCNSFCLMCSQPPRDVDDRHLIEELMLAVPLIDIDTREIGITGGEPTLLEQRFFDLINLIKISLPYTSLHILTNGRTFSNPKACDELALIRHPDLMLGIPLYSDVSHIHDFVVQADSAFDETIRGILNLKKRSQKVEIRIVLHKQTINRLPELAEFISRNLQFVDHVALMGLEITGFTRANLKALWIDPFEYMEELLLAVNTLTRSRVRTSIYNLPLCLLPESLWSYAVKSISDWKNKYYQECENCSKKSDCGGFFASSDLVKSDHIHAIQ